MSLGIERRLDVRTVFGLVFRQQALVAQGRFEREFQDEFLGAMAIGIEGRVDVHTVALLLHCPCPRLLAQLPHTNPLLRMC